MPLSEIQLRTATIILALPEAAGFALAGGAALVIHEIVDRGTKDLGFDPASHDPVLFAIGPVRHLSDLAGDKLLALFSRAAARDFIDVAALLQRFTKSELCTIAAAKDQGFNIDVLADAFGVLPTYDRDDEYPTVDDADYHELTAVFAEWQREIRHR